jgi:hypothetical protein
MNENRLMEEQNLEQELLASFEVEELEKRFEMGWCGSGEIAITIGDQRIPILSW